MKRRNDKNKTKNSDIVSIIIPTYNSSKTLPRCLDSVLAQSYNNLEIIVVDDGSSDNTIAVANKYSFDDARIKIIKQQHIGPNCARGKGVQLATGKYIMFVDADDFMADSAVCILMDAFKEYDVDVIRFNAVRYDADCNKTRDTLFSNDTKVFTGEQIKALLLTTFELNNVCLQIYKANLIKKSNAFSNDLVFGEDFFVNLDVHSTTEKILLLNECLYYYCDNLNSTTKSMDRCSVIRNIKDRAFVSKEAINYALQYYSDNEKINLVIYAQLSMLRDNIVCLSMLKGYKEDDFLLDFKGLDVINDFSVLVPDTDSFNRFLKKLSFIEKIKNKIIIDAILSVDYNSIWAYVRAYSFYILLKPKKLMGNKRRIR